MIIDTLDNISSYKKLSKDIYAGLIYLKNIDNNTEYQLHVCEIQTQNYCFLMSHNFQQLL